MEKLDSWQHTGRSQSMNSTGLNTSGSLLFSPFESAKEPIEAKDCIALEKEGLGPAEETSFAGNESGSSDNLFPNLSSRISSGNENVLSGSLEFGLDGRAQLGLDNGSDGHILFRNGSDAHPGHPNIFVRGLPLTWSEDQIAAVFEKYGTLTSLRLVRHSVTKLSLGYGFVRFKDPESAQAAINGLNGAKLLGHVLQVKFADADAGPPCSGSSSGLTPCDSCYVKNLPTSYGVQQIKGLFARFGGVQDVKIFPCLDHTRGASALVRMESIAAASTAIQHLNGINPPGSLQAILVRYAESSAEKAARLSRKEKLQKVQAPQAALLSAGSLDADQIRQSLAALSFPEVRGAQLPSIPDNAAASQFHQNNGINRSAPNRSAFTSASTSLEIHGTGGSDSTGTLVELLFLPEAADKLWVYENFAKFGPIWKVTIEDLGSACILFGSAAAAWAAIMAMDGVISAHGNPMRVRIKNPAAGVAPRSHSLNDTTEEKIAGILGQILPGSIQSIMPPTQHINMDPLLRARSEHWH